jgi:glycosyltransferase involved in cell wall biosynthesis
MKILLLCEGDAERMDGSFSGSSKSLLDHLRQAGHQVLTGDTDLYGIQKYLAAAATVVPDREKWGVRFHLGAVPFRMRTGLAARHIAAAGPLDAVLQIGATFEPRGRGRTPYFLFCDSNIRMADRGRESGQSQAASLTPSEVDDVAAREATVYRGAAGVFTLSERLRRSFIEDFGLPPAAVHTAGAGPNLDLARIPPRAPRAPDQPPTVLFVGVQFERKGGDLLLRAFRRVREVIPQARLLIVGPRDLQVDQPGVENLGFLRKDVPSEWEQLIRAYASADVFCLPTRFEPFGIVYIEAMFFGLPCIGPDAWAIPEMIDDGVTGFLVAPDSEEALTDRMVRLLGDPGLARRMGEAGFARATRQFTWKAVATRVTAAMDEVLQRQSGVTR